MKKIFTLFISLTILILVFAGCTPSEEKAIQWVDPTLKELVYDELDIDDTLETTPQNFDNIKTIIIVGDDIVINPSSENSLYDLEDYLDDDDRFEKGAIKKLDDLKNFKNLSNLIVVGNDLENIEFVKDIESLSCLALESCNISDISPLKNCKNIEKLYLDFNNISDISPIAKWEKLPNEISFYSNNISDISALSARGEQVNLKYLNLGKNNIENVSPLKGFTSIDYLNLSKNNIQDASPLDKLNENSVIVLIGNPCFSDHSLGELGEFIGEQLGRFGSGLKEGFLEKYK